MKNWMDLNGDGKIDGAEMMFAGEMLCTSREEHEALFGDTGDFEDDAKDDFEIDAMAAGLDVDELELMDPDDRAEALEEVNDEIRKIIDDMFDTMYQEEGIGLAAPQVDILQRIITIDIEGDKQNQS